MLTPDDSRIIYVCCGGNLSSRQEPPDRPQLMNCMTDPRPYMTGARRSRNVGKPSWTLPLDAPVGGSAPKPSIAYRPPAKVFQAWPSPKPRSWMPSAPCAAAGWRPRRRRHGERPDAARGPCRLRDRGRPYPGHGDGAGAQGRREGDHGSARGADRHRGADRPSRRAADVRPARPAQPNPTRTATLMDSPEASPAAAELSLPGVQARHRRRQRQGRRRQVHRRRQPGARPALPTACRSACSTPTSTARRMPLMMGITGEPTSDDGKIARAAARTTASR